VKEVDIGDEENNEWVEEVDIWKEVDMGCICQSR
jgi:hypothetical protein